MKKLVLDSPVEQRARDTNVSDVAYGAGYADGIALLHVHGRTHLPAEPLQCTHDRYVCFAQLEHPTAEARAYIAGFRDVAADNLHYPPHHIEFLAQRIAA
jgi:hypothetical protein